MATTAETETNAQNDLNTIGITGAEIAKQHMVAGAEAVAALCQAGEAVQQAQLHLAQRAALLHRQAADNLRKATSPIEVAGIQSTLMVYQIQEGFRFLQELALVATGGASSPAAADAMPDAVAPAPAVAAAAAVSEAAVAAAQAWQKAFNGRLTPAAPGN